MLKNIEIKVFASSDTKNIKVFIPYHLDLDYLEKVFDMILKDLREED